MNVKTIGWQPAAPWLLGRSGGAKRAERAGLTFGLRSGTALGYFARFER